MSDAVTRAGAAYDMFGVAYRQAVSEFDKQLADGLGQLASAVSDLAKRQERIEMLVANQR
jgi:hypothetical protein